MTTATPHILIYEPEATGHQMEYIRHILKSIETQAINPRVTLLTSTQAMDHPNCRRLAADFAHYLTCEIAPPVVTVSQIFRRLGAFYERQWRQAESLAQWFDMAQSAKIDFVLLPHLEAVGLVQLCLRRNLLRGKPWATIAIAIRFHHRACGIVGPFRGVDILQHIFFRWILRDPKLTCFGTIDPYLRRAVGIPKVAFCPDPCAVPVLHSVDEARKAYGIRLNTCVVLVYGFLDRRKCIDVLLRGVAQAIPNADLTVLLAGPQHPHHLASALNSEAASKLRDRGRLVEVNRFIVNGHDIDPMSAADISWVFYERNFVFSSSVLVRSGLSRRAVIARRQGIVGRMVEDNQLGLALSSDTPDEVSAAITKLALNPELRNQMGDNGAAAFTQNTPEKFSRPIINAIRKAVTVS